MTVSIRQPRQKTGCFIIFTITFLYFLSVFFTLSFAASTTIVNKEKTTTPSTQAITVLLDWLPNPDHAPLIIAEEKGFFAKHHLKVKLVGPADPADPPKLVAAGKADMAITYEPQFIRQLDQGLPLVRVGTLVEHPLTCLAVLQSSSIHTLHDLKGKRIAHSVGGTDSILLETMLAHAGLKTSDVELINVHYNLSQSLLSGKVDAVMGIMRTLEVTEMKLAGKPVRVFLPEKSGVPDYDELIFVVNRQHANDPRWPAFFAALKESTAWLKKHPSEGWSLFADAYPAIDTPVDRAVWHATIPHFPKKPGKITTEKSIRFASFMQSKGYIRTIHKEYYADFHHDTDRHHAHHAAALTVSSTN